MRPGEDRSRLFKGFRRRGLFAFQGVRKDSAALGTLRGSVGSCGESFSQLFGFCSAAGAGGWAGHSAVDSGERVAGAKVGTNLSAAKILMPRHRKISSKFFE